MASELGKNIKVQIFGQSHSQKLGVVIDGLPAGLKIDMEKVNFFLQRRAGGKNAYSTKRKESDIPEIVSGMVGNTTCGAPLCALFDNSNVKGSDYDKMKKIPRPSHADYTAYIKHEGFNDGSGGGHFSGRLTLPMCFAGAICLQLLSQQGIEIIAHISAIGDIYDVRLNPTNREVMLTKSILNQETFPTLSEEAGIKMVKRMEQIAKEGDSIGGKVECGIFGLPVGIGNPIFDNLESCISYGIFGIPAVKGIAFGAGFEAAGMLGSECNDAFIIKNGEVETQTNHSGGIQGGISNGMPVIFETAFKPTPSIYKEQRSVNLETMQETMLQIEGRHDPCIVPRAVPCVEAITAIVICDMLAGEGKLYKS